MPYKLSPADRSELRDARQWLADAEQLFAACRRAGADTQEHLAYCSWLRERIDVIEREFAGARTDA